MSKWNYDIMKPVFDQCLKIYNSDLSWVDKYDAIFELYRNADFELDWYNPDDDYDDDTIAFMGAFKDHMEKLEMIR